MILFRLRKPVIAFLKYKQMESFIIKFKFSRLSLSSVDRWLSENATGY